VNNKISSNKNKDSFNNILLYHTSGYGSCCTATCRNTIKNDFILKFEENCDLMTKEIPSEARKKRNAYFLQGNNAATKTHSNTSPPDNNTKNMSISKLSIS